MTMWLKMTLTLMITLLRPRGSEIARLRFYQPSKEDSKRKKRKKKVLQKTVYATL